MDDSIESSLVPGPIPAVDPSDLERAWPIFLALGNGEGIDAQLLTRQLSPGANIPVVAARTMMAKTLMFRGQLDPWKEGDTLNKRAFEVLANCSFVIPESDHASLVWDTQEILKTLRG